MIFGRIRHNGVGRDLIVLAPLIREEQGRFAVDVEVHKVKVAADGRFDGNFSGLAVVVRQIATVEHHFDPLARRVAVDFIGSRFRFEITKVLLLHLENDVASFRLKSALSLSGDVSDVRGAPNERRQQG